MVTFLGLKREMRLFISHHDWRMSLPKNDAKQRPPFPFMVRRQRLAPNWGEEF